jgi:hypothetical protein
MLGVAANRCGTGNRQSLPAGRRANFQGESRGQRCCSEIRSGVANVELAGHRNCMTNRLLS